MPDTPLPNDVQATIVIARQAGDLIMTYYNDAMQIDYKEGNDPVTDADHAADEFIRTQLQQAFPHDTIISEENDYMPDSLS